MSPAPVQYPTLELRAPDGAYACVHLNGGHVTSWIPAGSTTDRLFLSRHAEFGHGVSIRGGIPVIFPQFGPYGAGRHHGFARLSRWTVLRQVEESGGARLLLELNDSDETRARWPFVFHAELSIMVGGAALTVELTVVNTDGSPFSFTAALHPYFAVADIAGAEVRGLSGTRYIDALQGGKEERETAAGVRVAGAVDRIYLATADVLELREPQRTLRIEKRGFPEIVIWNPGAEVTDTKPDFAPGDERLMLCVEAAVVRPSVTLNPGEQWVGTQIMTALS